MKYLVALFGAILLLLLAQNDTYWSFVIPFWVFGILSLYSFKQTEEYKILERKDGFGTTYIPVLVQHSTLLWLRWDRYGFVYPGHIGETPDSHTYFEGAKFVIEQYKLFLEKSKVKIEINEKSVS